MAATTESKKTTQQNKGKPDEPATVISGLRVTTKRDGFRRAGREWTGTTELSRDELNEEQLEQIHNEPLLIVEDIVLTTPESEVQD